jgi:hypothetical protein
MRALAVKLLSDMPPIESEATTAKSLPPGVEATPRTVSQARDPDRGAPRAPEEMVGAGTDVPAPTWRAPP